MQKDSLTFKAFKNASYSFVGTIFSMIIAIFCIPIIVLNLGPKEYGIYLFVTSVISILGLSDLGFGTSITKHMAQYQGKKDTLSIIKLAHTANSVFMIIGLVGLVISISVALIGPNLLPERFSEYNSYSILFIIAGFIFLSNTIYSTYSAILNSFQKFDVIMKMALFNQTFSIGTMLIVSLTNKSLVLIFLSQLIISIINLIFSYFISKKIVNGLEHKMAWDNIELKKNYSFSLIMSINNIASSARDSLARVLIPFYAGPTNLTYYNMGNTVATKIPTLSNTLGASILPMASELDGANNTKSLETFYIRSTRLILIGASALTITAISLSYPALYYWLNPEFAEKSQIILIILSLANLILSMYGSLYSFLLGIGKVWSITITSIISGVINIIFLIILMPKFGINGAAFSFLISVIPIIFLFAITEKKYLNISDNNRIKHYLKQIFGITVVSTIIFLLNKLLLIGFIFNLLSLLIVGGISVTTFIIIYKLLGFFEKRDWEDIERFYEVVKERVLGGNKIKQI